MRKLSTAFTGVESLLNSRQLTYQTADSHDDVPLTPNHFLHGKLGGQFAPETVNTTDFSPPNHWRKVQKIISQSVEEVAAGIPFTVKHKTKVDRSCQGSEGRRCGTCLRT